MAMTSLARYSGFPPYFKYLSHFEPTFTLQRCFPGAPRTRHPADRHSR